MNLVKGIEDLRLGGFRKVSRKRTTYHHAKPKIRLEEQLNLDPLLTTYQPAVGLSATRNHVNYQQGPLMACDLAGSQLAVGDEYGNVIILDTLKSTTVGPHHDELASSQFMIESTFVAHENAIFDLKWRSKHQNEPHLLTASGDQSIALWDVNHTGGPDPMKPVINFKEAHKSSVKTISISGHNPGSLNADNCATQMSNLVLSGSRDGEIKLWDLRVDGGLVGSLPDAHLVAPIKSLTKQRKRSTGDVIRSVPTSTVSCVLFDALNPHYFYSSGTTDGTIKMWDIRAIRSTVSRTTPSGAKSKTTSTKSAIMVPVAEFTHPSGSNFRGYSHLIQSSDGKRLFANCLDNNIYSFPLQDRSSTLASYYSRLESIKASGLKGKGKRKSPPNDSGSPLTSASHRSSQPSPRDVQVYEGHRVNNYTRLALMGDNYLLSGSTDGLVSIWSTRPLDRKSYQEDESEHVGGDMTLSKLPLSEHSGSASNVESSPSSSKSSIRPDIVSPFTLAARARTKPAGRVNSHETANSATPSRVTTTLRSNLVTSDRPPRARSPLAQLQMDTETCAIAVHSASWSVIACSDECDIAKWSLPTDLPTRKQRNAYSTAFYDSD